MASKKRGAETASRAGAKPKKKSEGLDARLGGGIAVLVAGLAALVWWSLPNEKTPPEVVIQTEAGAVPELGEPDAGAPLTKIDRAPRAMGELIILTAKPEADVRAAVAPDEIAKHLAARHCGAGCDVVKKELTDEDAFAYELRSAEDVVLPPKDTLDVVAIGLSPAERDGVAERKQALVIEAEGNPTPEQPAARLLFAVAAELAERLDGFVYDETERRIFDVDEMLARTIRAPAGTSVFQPELIAIQLFRQEDGTERMTTLGMLRFGVPDLCIQGANMTDAPLLAGILDDAARQVVDGATDLPLTIALEPTKQVRLGAVTPERDPTDPENDLVELTPEGGPTREAWDKVVTTLYGGSGDESAPDEAVAKKIRATLPDAVKRFQGGEGYFFVKGPFPIPEDERLDGGEGTKQLWIQAASCSPTLCSGMFTPEPSAPTNIAPGKTVSVNRAEALDWMLRQRDGGTAGGETLRARVKR